MGRKIIIGSRGSNLALWQANHVSEKLRKISCESEIKIIKTQGDRIQHLSFDKLEGKGFFTKELEDKLLSGEIDLAVHSHKDLPTESPEGLKIAAVSEREDPSELLLVRKDCLDQKLKFSFKKNAVVGSSSARRKSQLLSFRPDAKLKDIRGNVPTRIDKLRRGDFDAILLAFAGANRLKIDLSEFHVEKLNPLEFIPAPAQGVLALQIRENDAELTEILHQIHNKAVADEIAVERQLLNLLQGGCHIPLGVFCKYDSDLKKYRSWTAMAETWSDFPKRTFLENAKPDEMAETILAKLKNQSPKSVFITRDLADDSYFLRAMKAYRYPVFGKALIKIKHLRFTGFPNADWIFFSSKHAVKHFFEQEPKIAENVKFGVSGNGTEMALKKHGYRSVFTGQGGDMAKVGKHFAKLCLGQTVLFPQAKASHRSVQKQLSAETKIHDLHVYETEQIEQAQIPQTEVVVLTSPSNAEAYFNLVSQKPKHFITIGSSTAAKLRELGQSDFAIANTPEEWGLAEAVFGLGSFGL